MAGIGIREFLRSLDKGRVQRQRLSKVRLRLLESRLVAPIDGNPASQIQGVCLRVDRLALRFGLVGAHSHLQGAGNAHGDVVLQRQHVAKVAGVRARPGMGAVLRVDSNAAGGAVHLRIERPRRAAIDAVAVGRTAHADVERGERAEEVNLLRAAHILLHRHDGT